jgi:hypothetical protein
MAPSAIHWKDDSDEIRRCVPYLRCSSHQHAAHLPLGITSTVLPEGFTVSIRLSLS